MAWTGPRRQRGGTAFAHLYRTARWQRLRKGQLEREPLCWRCSTRGVLTAASVCNHSNGHPAGETEEQFWDGPFDSQCAACHSGETARLERGATMVKGCDEDGWPIAGVRTGPAADHRTPGGGKSRRRFGS